MRNDSRINKRKKDSGRKTEGKVGITVCILHFVQPPTKEPSVILQLGSVLPGRLQEVEFTYSTDVRKSWHHTAL